MTSELNKELSEAISLNVYADWDDNYGSPKSFFNEAADECEKIVYEKQIELLREIRKEFLVRGGFPASGFTTYFFRFIDSKIKLLEDKLTSI